jgi:nucleotide-binding universal stress UspA family protein
MKNIIVPLDFSADALKGLDLAVLFASKTPIKIQLVYVQRRTDVPSLSEEEYKYAEKHFKQILETYKNKIPKDSSLNYIIKKGKVYQEVVNQAQAFPDSMIIGSTHGASGFEELFIGSNAQRIISATTRPVITLRTPVVQRTFATPRTDRRGRWAYRYRFGATHGTVRYRFRARIRREAAYPYELGYSRRVTVTVRG